MTGRIRFGLAAIFVACASVFFAAPAAADTQPDPQLSNVPYLAWRGEQVRLVKCEPGLPDVDAVDFLLVDWSGDPHLIAPQLEPGTVSTFTRSWDGALCVAGTFTSQKAGLAQIKLVISDNGTAVLKHDFLVAWMHIGSVNLSESGGANPLPAGLGPFNELRVDVTGTFPLLQNYTELGIGDSITLPADWPTLARALATDRGPLTPDPSLLWDIHDDQAATEGHGTGTQTSCLTELVPGGIDAVDNCIGGGETGPFSRIWTGFTNPTIGPFDPQRAGQTLLSDGKLDAGDAPMPALRVDFAIAPNTPGGINGVGFFTEVDKHVTYSRDGLGSSTAHNLYAPFYERYIPATAAPVPEASGTDGPQIGNNFNGYLNDNPYHFWDVAEELRFGPGGLSGCALFVNRNTTPAVLRQLPSGLQAAVVYTDEHGEARIRFISGLQFFFDNLGALLNANGGCDLAGIDTLGTATITATGRYPYQFVTAQPVTSNPITKVVTNLFEKSITCYPKGPGAQNAIAAICVAHAQDIDGAPFSEETVCFMADFNAMDIQFFNGTINGINLSGTSQVTDPRGLRRICVLTDANGNAAVEIFNSNPTIVDVTAFFLDQGLLRSIKVPFPITAQVGPANGTQPLQTSTPNSGGGSNGTPPPSGSGSSTVVEGIAANGAPIPGASPYDASDYRIVSAKLRRPARGRPFMQIQVNGPTRAVTVRVRMMGRARELGSVTYVIETGKRTRIEGMRIPKTVRMLRLSVQV